MKSTIQNLLVMHALVASAIAAQGSTSIFDHSCISSLELPTRGLLAARSETSGIVHAVVHIGEEGHPSKVVLKGGNRGLQGEVRVAMKLSSFAPECRGRVMEFIFGFVLEDPPTDYLVPPAVSFKPPNRFDFIFRRVKPNLDPGSPPPAPGGK